MKTYTVVSAPLGSFSDLLTAQVGLGFTPVGELIAYNDGSAQGNPVLIQLLVLEEE